MTDLIDRNAVLRHRARVQNDPVLFLQDTIARETEERLQEVNRTFTAPAIVTPWPQVWGEILPDARVVPDTPVLDLEPGAHDLVIHSLCLHWAEDPVGQLIQCARALRPDGLLIATLFGGDTLHELRATLAEAESQISGGLSPRVLPMGDIRDLGGLMQRAGFAMPVADSAVFTVRYDTLFHLMRDLRGMGETNAMSARLRHPSTRALFAQAAQIYANNFAREDGRIAATFEVVTLTGWTPDPSQPQPLKPGSATHRLDEVLQQLQSETKD